MDTSVLNRTIAITHNHVELDTSANIEEKWGDVSINHSGFVTPDELVIKDSSLPTEGMRHTHLEVNDVSTKFQETIDSIYNYYIDNNLYPVPYFFKGGGGGTSDMVPIPDEFINNLDTE